MRDESIAVVNHQEAVTRGAEKGAVATSVILMATPRLRNLRENVLSLKAYFDSRNEKSELFVIGDFEPSGDQVSFIAELSKEINVTSEGYFNYLRVRERLGLADHLRSVQRYIRGARVLVLENNANFVIADVEALLLAMDQGCDFANGVRSWEGEPIVNRIQSKLFNWVTARLTGSPVQDVNSTIKAFDANLLDSLPLYGDFFRFLPALAQKQGFSVVNVGVHRKEGKKKATIYGPFSYIRRLLDILNLIFITRFTEKPLRFFGGLGASALCLGFILNLIVTFQKFAYSKPMSERPLLLLGILLIVVGIQFISIGLIGEIVVYSKTKDNEGYEIERII